MRCEALFAQGILSVAAGKVGVFLAGGAGGKQIEICCIFKRSDFLA